MFKLCTSKRAGASVSPSFTGNFPIDTEEERNSKVIYGNKRKGFLLLRMNPPDFGTRKETVNRSSKLSVAALL